MDTPGGDRAQSNLVGAVLLFGFLVLAFASYQAFVVPQQNAEVEFQHSQRVQQDVLDVRNGVMEAAANGRQPFTKVELGATFPSRTFALNPPPATGTLRTTDLRPITVLDENGNDISSDVCPGTAQSRLLRYEASYREFHSGPTLFVENTVAYKQYDSANLTMSRQRLLSDRTVNLVPIRGEYQKSAVGTTTVEPIAGPVVATSVTDPEITVPTRLDQATWNELLSDELDAGESATVSNGKLTLSLSGSYRVVCSPVGINRKPPSGARSGGLVGDDKEVNPAGSNTVQLVGADFDSTNDVVTLTFKNTFDSDRTFQQARIPFYLESSKNTEVGWGKLDGNTNDNLTVGDPFEPVQSITVPGNGGTKDVTLELDSDAEKSDFYGLSIIYNDSVTRRYFIEHEKGGGGGGNAANNVQLVSTSSTSTDAGGTKETLNFTLENTGSSGVTIERIAVNSTDISADEVDRPGGDEFERTDGIGSLDQTITIGGPAETLGTTAIIGAGNTADFGLGRFMDTDTGSQVDMKGQQATITLYFSDGSEKELVITG